MTGVAIHMNRLWHSATAKLQASETTRKTLMSTATQGGATSMARLDAYDTQKDSECGKREMADEWFAAEIDFHSKAGCLRPIGRPVIGQFLKFGETSL